jgi:hypothetical protein
MSADDRREEPRQARKTTRSPQWNSADYEEFLEMVEERSRQEGYAPSRTDQSLKPFGPIPTRTHAGEIWRVGPYRLLVGGEPGDARFADLQLSRWEAERGQRAVKLE